MENGLGMDVLLGAEIRLNGSNNDCLLYGLAEEILRSYPKLYEYDLESMYCVIHERGVLVFQAHPSRAKCTSVEPCFLDGMEVANANPCYDSQNPLAAEYAQMHVWLRFAGSDCHREEDAGRAGLRASTRITDLDKLKQALSQSDTELYKMRNSLTFAG